MPALQTITSRQHPFVKRCRAVAAGRGEGDDVLLDGPHVIGEALDAGVPLVGLLSVGRHRGLAERAASLGVPCLEASEDIVESASAVRTGSGLVAIGRWRPRSAVDLVREGANGLILSLFDVQDPGNVGGMIRSADALGASAVLALGATANPAGWKALRAAMGSTFRVPVGTGTVDEAIVAARAARLPVVASVARGGSPLDAWGMPPACLLLVGNEGSGLPLPLVTAADQRVTIPMRPGTESLNVGVGAALILWEWRRRQIEDRR